MAGFRRLRGTDAWVHEGGPALAEIGSSSRDVRRHTEVLLPGRPLRGARLVDLRGAVRAPGPRLGLQRVIESRGGIRGRMADLLSDETGWDSVLGVPLQTLLEFPGSPWTGKTSTASWPALARTAQRRSGLGRGPVGAESYVTVSDRRLAGSS
jgi:hypothetical protein